MTNEELKAYIERILDERDRAYVTATKELERRLEGLNELRAEVVRDRSMFVGQDKSEMMHNAIERRISDLELWRSKAAGIVLTLIVLSSLLSTAISIIWSHAN